MEIRVLGPLEVDHGNGPTTLRGAKPRQVLTLLTLRANRPVPAEQLIEELWEGDQPPSAATALRVHIRRLRQILEPERATNAPSIRLPASPHGYLLRVEPDELDAERFERLLVLGRDANAEGDPESAVRHLGRALELWRGPPLADACDLRAVLPDLARLEELRAAAFEELAEAYLTLGDHAVAIDLLTAATEAYPLRERLIEQLVLLLYRSGRQAEALRAYAELVRRLDEQLGIEPSLALRKLEEDVLLQRSSLDWAPESRDPIVVRDRPDPPGRFIGRRHELDVFRDAYDAAAAGERRLMLVAGHAGVGKSTLLGEISRRATAAGALVLTGRCDPDPAGEYQPLVEILQALVGRLDPAGGKLPHELGVLGVLGVAPGASHASPDVTATAQRYQLFAAIAGTIVRAPGRPVVVAVEDLHWADEPTLLVLRHLLRDPELEGLLVLGTFRDDELSTRRRELIDRIAPRPRRAEVQVEGFDQTEVRAMLRATAPPDAVQTLVGLVPTIASVTRGNPLFIRELLRELDEQRIEISNAAELEATVRTIAPAGVRALVSRRVARLSERARDVLHTATVVGRQVSTELLATACDLSADETLDALEESLAARLLAEYPGDSDVFEFPHALIRNVVYNELPEAIRQRLHERVGVALETMIVAGGGPSAADLARHFVAALPLGAPEKAALYARQAADEAVERFAFSEAAPWYELALDLGGTAAWSPNDLGLIQFDLARALENGGQLERARDAYMAAADFARAAANAELLADIGVSATGPWNLALQLQPAVHALLDDALSLLGPADRDRRVQVLNSLAATLYYTDPEREGHVAQAARELAEELGDTAAVAAGNLALHRWLTHEPAARRERLALSEQTVELTRADDCRHLHLRAARLQLADLLENGRVRDFDRELDGYEHDAGELRSPPDIYWSMALRATQATLHGDLSAAEQRARGALTRGRELEQTDVVGTHVLHLFVIRYQQARLAELVTGLSDAPEPQQGYRAGLALAAVACAETGRTQQAVQIVRQALGSDGQRLQRDNFWLAAIALCAGAAAEAADDGLVNLLTEMLAPFADHVVVFGAGAAVLGCGHHWLGVLASAQGDTRRAIEHLDAAVAIAEEMDAPYWIAQARLDAARTLRASGRAADVAASEALAAAAISAATANGYARILQQATTC